MGYGNRLGPLGHSLSCPDVVDCMQNVRAIVSVSAPITDAGYDIFQDDEPVLSA